MQLFQLFSVEKLLQVALFMGFLEQRASRGCEFRKTNMYNFQPSTILILIKIFRIFLQDTF